MFCRRRRWWVVAVCRGVRGLSWGVLADTRRWLTAWRGRSDTAIGPPANTWPNYPAAAAAAADAAAAASTVERRSATWQLRQTVSDGQLADRRRTRCGYLLTCWTLRVGELTSQQPLLSWQVHSSSLCTIFSIQFQFIYLDKTKHKCQGHVGTYRHHSNIHDRVVIAVQ